MALIGKGVRGGVVHEDGGCRTQDQSSLDFVRVPPRRAEVSRDHRVHQVRLVDEIFNRVLLQIRQNLIRPSQTLFVGPIRSARVVKSAGHIVVYRSIMRVAAGWKAVLRGDMVLHRQADLLELVHALRTPSRLACRLYRWQQKCH